MKANPPIDEDGNIYDSSTIETVMQSDCILVTEFVQLRKNEYVIEYYYATEAEIRALHKTILKFIAMFGLPKPGFQFIGMGFLTVKEITFYDSSGITSKLEITFEH